MFSRIFFSRSKGVQEQGPLSGSLGPAGRSPSPQWTESASMSASAPTGAPGSPTRVPMPPSRSASPIYDAEADRAALQAILATCPPKTLHAYMLSQLPTATPAELHAVMNFFAAFEPPQQLHCVRCHKQYFEVENDDRSCTMAHDDDSAEVEHVGYAKGSAAGAYETRWDCCGRTVDGDGDLGPPSGWCYEGKHTMDRKRARYRNDSTIANDRLQSCEARGCHRKRMRTQIPVSDDARSMRSARSEPEHVGRARSNAGTDSEKKPKKRAPRKRTQKPALPDEGEGESQQDQEDPAPKKKRRKVA